MERHFGRAKERAYRVDERLRAPVNQASSNPQGRLPICIDRITVADNPATIARLLLRQIRSLEQCLEAGIGLVGGEEWQETNIRKKHIALLAATRK